MEKEPGGGCYSLYSRTAALHDITKQGLSLIRLERIKKKFPPRNTSNTTRPQEKSEEKKKHLKRTLGFSSTRIN
jgi:hypothetical protein